MKLSLKHLYTSRFHGTACHKCSRNDLFLAPQARAQLLTAAGFAAGKKSSGARTLRNQPRFTFFVSCDRYTNLLDSIKAIWETHPINESLFHE
jgi:hypothetical protein